MTTRINPEDTALSEQVRRTNEDGTTRSRAVLTEVSSRDGKQDGGAGGGRGACLSGQSVGLRRWKVLERMVGTVTQQWEGTYRYRGVHSKMAQWASFMCLLQSEVIKHVRSGAKVQSQGAERAEEKKCCAEDPQEARVPPRPPRCSKLPGSQGQKGNWRMTRCSLSDKRKSSNSLGKINVLLAQKVRRDFSC